MKIGIGLGEIALGGAEGAELSLATLVADAQRAERDGFDSIWLANINGMDALTALTVIGRETSRVTLGTAVVPTFPRHPFAMAQQALTVQAATGNRLVLGIGLSHKMVIENMLGLSWAKPFSHMRDYLAVLGPLLHEGKVTFKGEHYTVNTMVRVPGAMPCPILVAALAPKMLALAGQVAEGTVTWMTGPKTLRDHVVPSIKQAAAEAGRPAPRVVASLPIAVHEDKEAARKSAAERYAIYGFLPSYRAMLDREGAAGPAEVAIVGGEAEVLDQLNTMAQAGVTEFVAATFPMGADSQASVARTHATLRKYMQQA